MRMCVDQTWHQQVIRQVDGRQMRKLRAYLFGWPDTNKTPSGHISGTVSPNVNAPALIQYPNLITTAYLA